ncbi:hypothetical protein [Phenylobacterium sp.]|uniref:hypothetical protein n=1 Tax=Phenylobacterium sp. TaxID=1871053 RepID=UPI0025F2215B|nr:hypothetical protein [Phenylobacterium sp.]MCA3715982.1 hypothetical protein [Phenylobacterium sp.]
MSRALFELLAEHASQGGDPVANRDAARWIKRKDAADLALMDSASAEPRIVTRQIRLVRINHNDESYFCTFGLPETEEEPPDLEIVDATPGIFALSVLEANVRPLSTVTAAVVKNVLDEQFHDNGSGYEGHELEEIISCFPSLVVYHATVPATYHEITDRVLGSILARTYFDGPISLEPETIYALTELFETDCELIPFRNIVQGVLSISWENLFLECYRCIEQLYGMWRFLELKNELNFALSPRDLAKLIEDQLSWRPKENEAFADLIKRCDEALISSICASLAVEGETHEKCSSKLAAMLYALRNNIVHYRPANSVVDKTDADWNIIIQAMLKLVAELYNHHARPFFGAA